MKRLVLSAMLLWLCIFIISACTKKETAQAPQLGVGLLGSSILNHLPAGSQGFLVADLESAAYKKFRTSQWGKSMDTQMFSSLEQLGLSGQKELTDRIGKLFQKLGFGGAEQGETKGAQLACFAGLGSGTGLGHAGCFAQAKHGASFDEELKSLQEFFSSTGETVSTDNCGNAPGFNVQIKGASQAAPQAGTLHFCGKGLQIAVANNKTVIEDFLAGKQTETLKSLTSSAEFTRLGQELKLGAHHYMMGFLNVKSLINVLPDVLARNQIEAKDSKDIQLLPIDALGFTQGMADTPSGMAVLSTAARNDVQKTWLTRFADLGSANVLNGVPSSSSFNLSLDGKFVSNLKQAIFEQIPEQERALLASELAPLDGLESFSLAVFSSNPTSPFPGLVISASSPKSGELQGKVKQQLEGALMGFGMPPSNWLEKEVEGVKASFIQSPLMGLGAYLGNSDNRFFLATSEDALRDTILALKDTSRGLLKSLPSQSQRLVEETKPILAAYGDFAKIAESVESVQGNLAAFTGGQGGADKSQMARLKELGQILVAVNFKNGNLKIESSYSAGAKG